MTIYFVAVPSHAPPLSQNVVVREIFHVFMTVAEIFRRSFWAILRIEYEQAPVWGQGGHGYWKWFTFILMLMVFVSVFLLVLFLLVIWFFGSHEFFVGEMLIVCGWRGRSVWFVFSPIGSKENGKRLRIFTGSIVWNDIGSKVWTLQKL